MAALLNLTATITKATVKAKATAKMTHKVAVLYQAIEPPVINGVRKPMKPGGNHIT